MKLALAALGSLQILILGRKISFSVFKVTEKLELPEISLGWRPSISDVARDALVTSKYILFYLPSRT